MMQVCTAVGASMIVVGGIYAWMVVMAWLLNQIIIKTRYGKEFWDYLIWRWNQRAGGGDVGL